jgi:hypothetical protein
MFVGERDQRKRFTLGLMDLSGLLRIDLAKEGEEEAVGMEAEVKW